jgi:hypothetical protein
MNCFKDFQIDHLIDVLLLICLPVTPCGGAMLKLPLFDSKLALMQITYMYSETHDLSAVGVCSPKHLDGADIVSKRV